MLKLLDFDNRELEKNFLEKQNNYNNSFNLLVFITGLFSVTGFYFLLYYFRKPEQELLFFLFLFFSGVFLCISIIACFFNFSAKTRQFVHSFTLLIICILSLSTSVLYNEIDFYTFYAGYICLLCAGLSFLRISFRYAVLFAFLLIISYEIIIIIIFSPVTYSSIYIIHYIFYCTLFVSLCSNFNLEKRERHNFVKLQIIVADRLKHSGADNELIGNKKDDELH